MKKILFNPFEKYSEVQLLIFGLTGVLLCSCLAYFFSIRFPTTLNIAPVKDATIWQPLVDNAVIVFSLSLFLSMAGLIVNKKTRIIDIIATAFVARSLYCLQALIVGGLSSIAGLDNIIKNPNPQLKDLHFTASQTAFIIILSFLLIGVLVWYIALLYNGFKTATNLKAGWHKVIFAIALLIAEITTPLLLLQLN